MSVRLRTPVSLSLPPASPLKGFKVQKSDVPQGHTSTFSKRPFYKIVLSVGQVCVRYGDRVLELNGVYLFFANPHVPYAVHIRSHRQTGYSCVFTPEFIKPLEQSESWQRSPLFNVSATPAFALTEPQQSKLSGLFEAMLAEQMTEYVYQADLMRNYLQLIIHEALRLQTDEHLGQFGQASLRVTTRFLALLEQQFPVDEPHVPLRLRTAQDFAVRLAIHVNYLNRSVKAITGRSTTQHISERLAAEAVSMLQQTDWGVAEIAYALGFEYPNNFSYFLKKTTGKMPKQFRIV